MGLKFVSLVMLCMMEQLFDKVKNFRFCQTLEPPNNGPLNKGIKEIIPGRNPYTITIQRCHCVIVWLFLLLLHPRLIMCVCYALQAEAQRGV